MTKLYFLPLKHKFVKEEIEYHLEARLTKRSMSPDATPVIVVTRKWKSGTPLSEMKWLVIDYQELNKQIPKVQMTQIILKGGLALYEMEKNRLYLV